MTVDERPYLILLSNKTGNNWYQMQFSCTVAFDGLSEAECLEGFEEMVHEMRKQIHDKYEIKK